MRIEIKELHYTLLGHPEFEIQIVDSLGVQRDTVAITSDLDRANWTKREAENAFTLVYKMVWSSINAAHVFSAIAKAEYAAYDE